jgi:hypothetical protein
MFKLFFMLWLILYRAGRYMQFSPLIVTFTWSHLIIHKIQNMGERIFSILLSKKFSVRACAYCLFCLLLLLVRVATEHCNTK